MRRGFVLGVVCWLSAVAGVWAAEVRTPQVAGQFYPAEPAELRSVVTDLLERQPVQASRSKPRVLIVPHAGYPYSGVVAASAFRQLLGQTYDGVVVVGFTHRFQFDGISVDTVEAYETPLGRLPIHQEAVKFLQTFDGVGHVEEAHESGEHSLEVQLPFVQVALGDVRLVSVLMGSASLEDAQRLAEALAALSQRGDYLFVFSTDLSHYHPYDQAQTIDERTVNAMLFETPQAVDRLFGAGQLEACGRGPILASLLLSAKLGYLEFHLLRYANSGDTAGDRSRVVGYAAIGIYERPAVSVGRLSSEAGMALVQAARQVLERGLGVKPSEREGVIKEITERLNGYPELSAANGTFVTLRKRGQLRGCIGRIQTPQSLAETVPVVALDSALRDTRFNPVRPEELQDINVEVSVLTEPVQLADIRDLVPGRDGVILEQQGHSGVFLPQVWEETGWTRVEFLQELSSQKAGLPPDSWRQATLHVFQDQIFAE